MSSHNRDNMKRIFVGNLPHDVRERDLENIFYRYGKIAFIDLKTRRGPPFAFVEFHDYRDAEDAVRRRDGREYEGQRLRVEFPRGRERPSRFKNGGSGGSSSRSAPQRRSKFRVEVTGLPSSGSWQDLKDHMREVGEVCYADVYKGGRGVVEFVSYDDMRHAIRKLNNTKFKSHEGESAYIKLREDVGSGDSRSRSRSPVRPRRRGSPSYSPVNRRRDSHSPGSRSVSGSPKAGGSSSRGGGDGGEKRDRSSNRDRRERSHHKRSRRAKSGSRSRSPTRSRSHSRSPSNSPRSNDGAARARDDRPRHRSGSPPGHDGDRDKANRGSSRGADSRDRSRTPSKTPSRSPSRPRSASPRSNDGGADGEVRERRDRSGSPASVGSGAGGQANRCSPRSRTRSKSPSRSPSPRSPSSRQPLVQE